jgi:hypothetical protein
MDSLIWLFLVVGRADQREDFLFDVMCRWSLDLVG